MFKEIIAENFPNLGKEMEIHVGRGCQNPYICQCKNTFSMAYISKPAKVNDKEKLLRAARQKKTYKGTPIRLSADFSAETLKASRERNDILKIMKDKNFQPRILYPVKISFRYDGEIKIFPDKQKLREFIAMRPPPTHTRIHTGHHQEGPHT